MLIIRPVGVLQTRLKDVPLRNILSFGRICRYSTVDKDPPVKYSVSQASQWKAEFSRRGISDDMPWFQPIVVSLSIAVFLIYFCYLREENDIDEILSVELYDRIEGLEESQLRMSLKYNLENGLETTAIKARLKELEEERKNK